MTKARNIAELANDISVDNNRDVTLNNLRGDQPMMFRNRIINGDMRIDQRNAGSAVTGSTAGSYTIDRWTAFQNYGTVTIQQSTTAPSGFRNSYYTTVTSPASVEENSIYSIVQHIEGSNVSDLNFGSSAAKTITISFQVRSSITGTYGVFLRNSAQDRYYASTFSISSANTFETKMITLAGDNQGTWLTDTGVGLTFGIVLGAGVNRQGTENTWTGSSSGPYTTSSQIDWMSNSGATFYITGVQLEEGTVPTPFEHRPIGMELSLCQRYFMRVNGRAIAYRRNDNLCSCFMTFPQCMRLKQPVLENITKGLLTNMQSQPYGTINDNSIAATGESEMIRRGFLYIEFYTDNTGHTFIPSWEGFNFDVNAEL